MIPSVGRIVHYRLASGDLGLLDYKQPGDSCNTHREGDVIPFLICRVCAGPDGAPEDTCVNGQGFVDGNFSLWLTSRQQGDGPGRWFVPPRVG